MTQNQSCCSTTPQQDTQQMPKIYIFPYLCTSCGVCAEVCPFGLPSQGHNKKYEISRPDLCTECSACLRNCPEKAIFMEEKEGCGCLWDVRQRRKNKAKVESDNCGSGCCSC